LPVLYKEFDEGVILQRPSMNQP